MTSILHSQLRKEAINVSLLPTLRFIGIGVVWIVLSDLALFLSQTSTASHFPIFHVEVLKGILFVVAMGAFFFVMQRKNEVHSHEFVELDLFKKNPQAMFIYNLETMEFLDVNEAAIGIYGYSRSEFLSMKICDIRPAEELPALVKSIEQLQNGYQYIGDSRHVHKNGAIIHIEVSAYSITFNKQHAGLLLSKDISNQLKAERALIETTKIHEKQMNDKLYEVALFNKELQVRIREINSNNDELIEVNKLLQQASRNAIARYEAKTQDLQQQMHSWMENVSDVLWSIDLNDERATVVSNGAAAFFGCSKKCIIDKPNLWETFIHDDDKKRIKNEMLQLNDRDTVNIEYKHTDSARKINQTVSLVRNDCDEVDRIVFMLRSCSMAATIISVNNSAKGDFARLLN
jgi:PAS domain S-box-containing protein